MALVRPEALWACALSHILSLISVSYPRQTEANVTCLTISVWMHQITIACLHFQSFFNEILVWYIICTGSPDCDHWKYILLYLEKRHQLSLAWVLHTTQAAVIQQPVDLFSKWHLEFQSHSRRISRGTSINKYGLWNHRETHIFSYHRQVEKQNQVSESRSKEFDQLKEQSNIQIKCPGHKTQKSDQSLKTNCFKTSQGRHSTKT